MARRSFGFGLLVSGVIGVVTACGGTVVERKSGTPSEQLEQDGPERCKTACKTIEACGLDSSDCACASSCTCVGSGDCTCPPPAPCMCEMMSGAATCERECTETVQKLLDDKSDCQAPMVAILDCLASATCKNGEKPCQAESRALKECGQKDRSSDPPPKITPPTDRGSGVVTCQTGSGLGTAPGAPPPSPGDVACSSGFQQCSDGRSYEVQCQYTTGSDLACSCFVDDVPGATFPRTRTVGASDTTAICDFPANVANELCGWNLG